MEILVDVAMASELRNRMGLSQDDLGECLSGSRRTVQRIEDKENPPKLSVDELNRLAKCLNVQPYMLWGELPVIYEYSVDLVENGAHLSELLLKYSVNDVRISALPELEDEQRCLISLAGEIDELKAKDFAAHTSLKAQIKWQMGIKNLYDNSVGNNRTEVDKQWSKFPGLDIYFSLVSYASAHAPPPGEEKSKWMIIWQTVINLQIVEHGSKPIECSEPTVRKSGFNLTDETCSDEEFLIARPSI
ncbi:helix-turn-helix transcriptional regulator [Alphaproteobacteria bacterium]|nr:helix-turn-helix transcriptional regulator [Alphaproteobacteria bacterium]